MRLFHYNDVYHVDRASAEPVGGVARFLTLVKEYRDGKQFEGQPKLLTLFSGDAFNPSLESSVTKGACLPPVRTWLRGLVDGDTDADDHLRPPHGPRVECHWHRLRVRRGEHTPRP